MAITQPEVFETVTAEDFIVPEHAHDFRVWPGVCPVCGAIGIASGQRSAGPAGNFQDPFPRFGADEYLTW